jgi:hypothetical protein
MLEYTAAKVSSVPDRISTQACSFAHLPHVSSFAFEARAFNSFSKFSWVSSCSAGGGAFGCFGGFAMMAGDNETLTRFSECK